MTDTDANPFDTLRGFANEPRRPLPASEGDP